MFGSFVKYIDNRNEKEMRKGKLKRRGGGTFVKNALEPTTESSDSTPKSTVKVRVRLA
jgi:hypothetical protein